jgi:hypothetical protein
LLNVSLSLHTKFAAVAHLAGGEFLRATENMIKFVIVQNLIVGLMLSIKEGQDLYPGKIRLKKRVSV